LGLALRIKIIKDALYHTRGKKKALHWVTPPTYTLVGGTSIDEKFFSFNRYLSSVLCKTGSRQDKNTKRNGHELTGTP